MCKLLFVFISHWISFQMKGPLKMSNLIWKLRDKNTSTFFRKKNKNKKKKEFSWSSALIILHIKLPKIYVRKAFFHKLFL